MASSILSWFNRLTIFLYLQALNDEKENVLPTISTTQPTKQSPPVRPKFVSKKFTPPAMRTRSVLPDSQQSSNPVLISISQPRLLSQYQSRKVCYPVISVRYINSIDYFLF